MYEDDDYLLYQSEEDEEEEEYEEEEYQLLKPEIQDVPQIADRDMMLVRTESGKWIKEVHRDDKMLQDLITPYTELGVVPAEIVLSGTIAEIVETQWPKYELAIKFRDAVMALDENDPKVGETRSMTAALKGQKTTSRGSSTPVIRLDEVLLLSNVLNLPEGWRMWVSADDRVSDSDYLNHIRVMGYEIMQLGDDSYSEMEKGRIWRHSSFVAGILVEAIDRYAWEIRSMLDNDVHQEIKAIIRGVMRNTVLRSINESSSNLHLDWKLINYRVLYGALRMLLPDGTRTSLVLDTLAMWMGNGDYRSKTFRGPVCAPGDNVSCADDNFPEMYDLLLKSFPDNVSPSLLGLEPIITDRVTKLEHPEYMNISSLAWWVAWVNHKALEFAETKVDVLLVEQFPYAIEFILMSTPGRSGLEFMMKVLDNSDKGGKNERIQRFLTLSKERLDKSSVPNSRVELSTKHGNVYRLREAVRAYGHLAKTQELEKMGYYWDKGVLWPPRSE